MLGSTSIVLLRRSPPLASIWWRCPCKINLGGSYFLPSESRAGVSESLTHPCWKTLTTNAGVLPVSPIVEALGVSDAQWRQKCQQWGLRGLKGNLEANLGVLERWGMAREARKKVVLGTLTLLNMKPKDLDSKLTWLMENLGFTATEVLDIVERHPDFLGFYPNSDIQPFIGLVTKEGYSKEDAKSMIFRHPPVVGQRDGFRTTARFFEGYLAFREGGFMKAIVKYPQILGHSDKTIRPVVMALMDLGLNRPQVCKMLRTSPQILGVPANDIKSKREKFTELGLTTPEATEVLLEAPDLMWLDHDEHVVKKMDWFRKEIGLGSAHVALILKKWPRVFIPSLESFIRIRSWFLDKGVPPATFSELCSRNVRILATSTEQLDSMFFFARDVLKKDREEILECPAYFTFSLEKRVLMRVAFLDCNGESYTGFSLESLVLESRRNFESRFGEARIKVFEERWKDLTLEEKLTAIRTRAYP